MIRNMQIRSKLIAVLVLPLLALTVLAAIGIRANVARGVQADRVNDQTAFAVSLSNAGARAAAGARPVGRLGRDRPRRRLRWRGLPAGGRQRGPPEPSAGTPPNLGTDDELACSAGGSTTAVAQFTGFDDERQRIEQDPSLTVERTLDIYSDLIANLLAVELELGGQTNDRNLIRNIATFVALGRFKEAASQERGLVYAVASAGQFAPGEFQRFATSLGAQDTWRAQFDATASAEQRARLERPPERPATSPRSTSCATSCATPF